MHSLKAVARRASRLAAASSITTCILMACSSSSTGAGGNGVGCSVDKDCATGLKCLPRPVSFTPDAGCAFANTECLSECTEDSQCASLGGNLHCFLACGGICE